MEYATSNIYVGVRCDYNKDMVCYPLGFELLKGKPGHNSQYDAFIETPMGFMSITTEKVLPVYDCEMYIKRNFAFDLEPIIYYMDSKVPVVMKRDEILDFIHNCYAPIKRENEYNKLLKK